MIASQQEPTATRTDFKNTKVRRPISVCLSSINLCGFLGRCTTGTPASPPAKHCYESNAQFKCVPGLSVCVPHIHDSTKCIKQQQSNNELWLFVIANSPWFLFNIRQVSRVSAVPAQSALFAMPTRQNITLADPA